MAVAIAGPAGDEGILDRESFEPGGVAGQGGDAGALSRAFLRAVWAEDRDISDAATIAAIVGECGHDAAALAPAMDAAHEQYRANTALAMENGVFGAPFYVVNGERFWGQDRLDHLDWHLGGRGPLG